MSRKVPDDTLEKSSSLNSNTRYIFFLTVSCLIGCLGYMHNSHIAYYYLQLQFDNGALTKLRFKQ